MKTYSADDFKPPAKTNTNVNGIEHNGVFYPFDKMIEGLSSNDYHSIQGVSSTQFGYMNLSNRLFDLRKFFRKESPAFDLGNLIHDACLLPDLVDESYIESPTVGLDTVGARQVRDANPDKMVVGQGDIQMAKDIAKLVNLVFGSVLAPATTKKEVSFLHLDKESGLIFRIRPDIYNKTFGMLMDIKSTKANNHKEFEKIIEVYDYDLSLAFYFDVLQLCGYPVYVARTGWICVPKSQPNAPFGFRISEELLEKGRSKYQLLLAEYIAFKKREEEHGVDNVENQFDDLFSKVAHSWAYRKENY
jgi:hypothetical protein